MVLPFLLIWSSVRCNELFTLRDTADTVELVAPTAAVNVFLTALRLSFHKTRQNRTAPKENKSKSHQQITGEKNMEKHCIGLPKWR